MKRILAALSLAAIVSQGTNAQEVPDFSGTWTMDLSRSEAAAQAVPAGAQRVVIRQQPNEIQIDTATKSGLSPETYTIAPEKPTDAVLPPATFRWEGPKLVTVLSRAVNGQTVTVTETRSLDPTGAEMTVETMLVVQHGYEGTSGTREPGSNYSTMKNIFVKQP